MRIAIDRETVDEVVYGRFCKKPGGERGHGMRVMSKSPEDAHHAPRQGKQAVDEVGSGGALVGRTMRTTSPTLGSANNRRAPPRAAAALGVPAPSKVRIQTDTTGTG